MKVLVDADACPGLDIIRRVCASAGVELITVASFRHDIRGENHIMVGPESQAADMAIINRTQRGDVVITQDWGLAGLALAKGARALSPWGHIFREEEMEGRLAQRALNARLRRGGVRLPGPKRRTGADDETLEKSLRSLLAAAPTSCPECGAPMVAGMNCWEQLGAVIAWEAYDPELLAQHFLTVASYNLQHPAQFTQEAIDGLRALYIEHLDHQLPIAEIRRRVGEATAGSVRVRRPEQERRPVLRCWRMTIADVYVPDRPAGAAQRVLEWANSIRSEL